MSVSFSDPMLRLAAMQLKMEETMYRADKEALYQAREAKHAANEEAIDKMHEEADCMRTGAYVGGGISLVAGGLQLAGSIKAVPSQTTEPQLTQAAGETKPSELANEANAAGAQELSREASDAKALELADQAKAARTAEAARAKSDAWARVLSTGGEALGRLASAGESLAGQARAKDREADSAEARNRAEERGWEADDAAERAQRHDRAADSTIESLRALLETKREGVAAVLAKM